MARKRMIDPSFWRDEKLGEEFEFHERLMFIGLWTFADDSGIGRANPKLLKSDIFPYDEFSTDDIERMLAKMYQSNMITLYEADGQKYYKVNHFSDYQTINRPTESKLPKPDDGTLMENSLNTHGELTPNIREDKLREDKLREDNICASEAAAPEPPHQKHPSKKENNALFEKLWHLYPRKRGKGQVSDASKLRIAELGEEHMQRCIDRFKSDMKAQGREMDGYMYGSTFFNSGYLDYTDAEFEKIDYSSNNNDERASPNKPHYNPFLDSLREGGHL